MIAEARVKAARPWTHVTAARAVTAAVVVLVVVTLIPAGARMAWLVAYLALVLVTCIALRSTRREPGTLLRRRIVRRGVVVLVVADCAALLLGSGPGPSLGLLVLLVVLNIALGGATQRVATAADALVDERQEAARNRAHRTAYATFAAVVVGAIVVPDVASEQTRAWLASAMGAGGWPVLLELLFVLPAMVLAFSEPDALGAEAVSRGATRSRVAAGLLALTVAAPVVLSLAVAFAPLRSSATVDRPYAQSAGTRCREFSGSRNAGAGIEADFSIHAVACWDGRRAVDEYGLNRSDCNPSGTVMAATSTVVCRRTTSADGTLWFTYTASVVPSFLPFLHRDVTLRLVVDRNGHVLAFP